MNLFLTMLAAGVLTSVHCVFMCGSMVLTYAVKGEAKGPLLERVLPHVAYQGAKMASYVTVGLALGAIGSAFDVDGIRGWVQLGAGAFMLMLGLQMTGWVPFLRRFSLKPPKLLMNALMRLRKKARADAAEGRASLATPLAFGSLTGLMPCAPLQTAQLAAASAGSALSGAVVMLGFGLGTAPLMLGFGAVSGYLSGRFKSKLQLVAALVVMGLGLMMLDRGLMMAGSPVSIKTVKQAVLGGPAQPPSEEGFARGADGVAEVGLTIRSVRYEPETLRLPAGEKVRLVVDRQEANACSAELWIPRMGVRAPLEPNGRTVVEVPASRAGTYGMTCQMGMMSGTVVVGGASRPLTGTLLPLGALLLAGAGWYAHARKRRAAGSPAKEGLTASELLLAMLAIAAAVVAGLALGRSTG